jgi:hypothetical protein
MGKKNPIRHMIIGYDKSGKQIIQDFIMTSTAEKAVDTFVNKLESGQYLGAVQFDIYVGLCGLAVQQNQLTQEWGEAPVC